MRGLPESHNANRRYTESVAPRDFNVSPYFEIIKPTLSHGFDYRAMVWADDAGPQS